MIEVVRFQYADYWPIWCLKKGGAVIQCFTTKEAAKQAQKKCKLANDL